MTSRRIGSPRAQQIRLRGTPAHWCEQSVSATRSRELTQQAETWRNTEAQSNRYVRISNRTGNSPLLCRLKLPYRCRRALCPVARFDPWGYITFGKKSAKGDLFTFRYTQPGFYRLTRRRMARNSGLALATHGTFLFPADPTPRAKARLSQRIH